MRQRAERSAAPAGGRWAALEPEARRVALALFALALAASIVAGRALFADGAQMLLDVLRTGGTNPVWWHRAFALNLEQVPAVLALRAGVTDLTLLAALFTLGCLLPWVIALWFCWVLARPWFWAAMLAAALGLLNTSMIPVGEHAVAHAFFWPAAFALLFVRPLTPFAALALLSAAALLLRSYETLLFLGPALAALAVWRALAAGERAWARAVLALAAALFLLAAAIAFLAVQAFARHRNFGDFRSGALELLLQPSAQIVWCWALALLLLLVLWRPRAAARLPAWAAAGLLGIALLFWAGAPLWDPGDIRPDLHHRFRAVNLIVPLALLALLLLLRRRPARTAAARPLLGLVAAAALGLQSLWTLGATLHWWGYLGTLRGVLASHQRLVEVGQTPLARGQLAGQTLGFTWDWTLPALSILLADRGEVRAILYRAGAHRPWNPADPAALPDLSAYGVSYDAYLAALRATDDAR